MNRKQKNKLFIVLSLLIVLSTAAALILYALKQNINLFYTPTQLLTANIHPEQNIRLGGYVKKHSVQYDASGSSVHFTIMDKQNEVAIDYQGVLPNLFREGQGVVVTGKLSDMHHLVAAEVLAKHDEKYVPRILAKELEGEQHAS